MDEKKPSNWERHLSSANLPIARNEWGVPIFSSDCLVQFPIDPSGVTPIRIVGSTKKLDPDSLHIPLPIMYSEAFDSPPPFLGETMDFLEGHLQVDIIQNKELHAGEYVKLGKDRFKVKGEPVNQGSEWFIPLSPIPVDEIEELDLAADGGVSVYLGKSLFAFLEEETGEFLFQTYIESNGQLRVVEFRLSFSSVANSSDWLKRGRVQSRDEALEILKSSGDFPWMTDYANPDAVMNNLIQEIMAGIRTRSYEGKVSNADSYRLYRIYGPYQAFHLLGGQNSSGGDSELQFTEGEIFYMALRDFAVMMRVAGIIKRREIEEMNSRERVIFAMEFFNELQRASLEHVTDRLRVEEALLGDTVVDPVNDSVLNDVGEGNHEDQLAYRFLSPETTNLFGTARGYFNLHRMTLTIGSAAYAKPYGDNEGDVGTKFDELVYTYRHEREHQIRPSREDESAMQMEEVLNEWAANQAAYILELEQPEARSSYKHGVEKYQALINEALSHTTTEEQRITILRSAYLSARMKQLQGNIEIGLRNGSTLSVKNFADMFEEMTGREFLVEMQDHTVEEYYGPLQGYSPQRDNGAEDMYELPFWLTKRLISTVRKELGHLE